jgi:hypothetical protein
MTAMTGSIPVRIAGYNSPGKFFSVLSFMVDSWVLAIAPH